MLTATVKLKLNRTEEAKFDEWLWHLTGVWNWAVRKIEQDAQAGIFYGEYEFEALLNGHSRKMGIPAHVLQDVARLAWRSWQRRFKHRAGSPRLKGSRNKLNSIPFRDLVPTPKNGRIKLVGLAPIRFHKQDLPEGKIKCARAIKKASGWYLCLWIDATPISDTPSGGGVIGIDPGFAHLLTLSSGDKIAHPRELESSALRLAQVQRGKDRKQTARIQERIANQRKDRNHKLSRRLVAENQVIAFSKDNLQGLSRIFGKSVASSSHSQLRSMLAYKCRAGGRQYIEVPSRNSTKTCSACGSLSGPTGYAGLKVRQWQCDACGADHDRDINAAINTLIVGLGLSHERYREITSENLDSVGGSLDWRLGVSVANHHFERTNA